MRIVILCQEIKRWRCKIQLKMERYIQTTLFQDFKIAGGGKETNICDTSQQNRALVAYKKV